MTQYMDLDRTKVHVIPHGLNMAGTACAAARRRRAVHHRVLCSRLPEKGLHLLAEAFRILCEHRDLPPVRLVAAGYLGKEDRAYLDTITQQMHSWGLAANVSSIWESRTEMKKFEFCKSFDVMSVRPCIARARGCRSSKPWPTACRSCNPIMARTRKW